MKKINYKLFFLISFSLFMIDCFVLQNFAISQESDLPMSPPNKTAVSALKYSYNAYKKKLYFTSASYMKLYLMQDGEVTGFAAKLLDAIIIKTNIFPFLDIPFPILSGITYSKNIYFVLAKKYFFKKDYAQAIVYLRKIPEGSFFYLSALQHLAGLYQMVGDKEQSQEFIDKCLKNSGSNKYSKIAVFEQRLEYIHDSCQALQARHDFKFVGVDPAVTSFKKIPLNSYVFPQTLFESSWPYYLKNDYMRAIGKNLTFQSPLLVDYFIPEAELVKVLSYLDLCYYEDAMGVIKHFDQDVKSKVHQFMDQFNLKNSNNYQFAKLFTDKDLRAKLGDSFFNKLLNVIWARPGFQTIKYYLQRINNEKDLVNRVGTGYDRKAFALAYRDFLEFFNDFVKIKFVKMAKNIIRLNNIFTEVELDVYSTIKYELYDEKNKTTSNKNKNKFYVSEIKRSTKQHYWNFHGEFWADELGNYIPYLNSKCGDKNVYEQAIKSFEN